MYLSDELEETDTLNEKQKQFMNEKVLGYQKDYTQVEDLETMESIEAQQKAVATAKKSLDPINVQPLDFTLVKVSELFKSDREHYFMDQRDLSQVECATCKLINDYTKVCPH